MTENKRLLTDENLECPYLFEMDGERYKFRGCKTWGEAEWAKKGWDEAIAKAKPIIEKPLRKEIDKLKAKLITTNVYYLKEIQQVKREEREMTLQEVGELIEHCDEIRNPDEDEALIYYGVKPEMLEALKQGKLQEK